MRTYDTPIGVVPSVTTILNEAISSSYLVPWAVKLEREMVLEKWWEAYKGLQQFESIEDIRKYIEPFQGVHKRVFEEAGDSGSLAHNMIQAWCEGLFEGNKEDYLLFLSDYYSTESIQKLSAWFKCIEYNKIVIKRSEMTVWHTSGFAGTLDAYGTFGKDKTPTIFDWKTSTGIYVKHWIQTEAYSKAFEERTHEPVAARCIVRLCKEENKLGEYELIIRPLEIGTQIRRFYDARKKKYVEQFRNDVPDHEEDWRGFLACKTIFDRLNR